MQTQVILEFRPGTLTLATSWQSQACFCFILQVHCVVSGVLTSDVLPKLYVAKALSRPSLTCLKKMGGFPGGAVVENLPANAGDTGSSPGLGRSHMPRSN